MRSEQRQSVTHDEDDERSGHVSASPSLLGCGRGRLGRRGGQVEAVGLRVQRDRLRGAIWVLTVLTTSYRPGDCSRMIAIVPSPPLELKIRPVSTSMTQPSGPGPISSVWRTLPLSASEITSFPLAQVLKSLRCLESTARPMELFAEASENRLRILSVRASNSTISLESSMLTKMCPLSSETANSGTPPSAREPTAFISTGSMAVVSLVP